MGLKCSVLGHAYGDTNVERDREEQGSEVVITIREVETCDRCGTERVVSENKEVTSIETPDDEGGLDAADDPESAEEMDAAEEATAETSPANDEPERAAAGEELSASEIVGGDSDESDDSEETAIPPEGSEPDAGAEIIDAESEAPVEGTEPVDEELADPTVDPDLEEAGTETPAPATDDVETGDAIDDDADDAVIIDDDETDDEEGERQPGEWPEEPTTGDDEWKPDTIGDADEDESEGEQATEATTMTVPDGQFRCPECEFTTQVESSSLRRGDFCPECRRGALVHETKDETRKE